MSDTPPPYTASSRVAPASDTKYPYNPTDYGVGSSGQNIYPSAHDYVPPPAEQQARIPSAPPAEQFQAQQQQPQQLQYQQYQQQGAASYQVQPQPQPQQYQQQVQPNHKVYYTKAGVPVEIQTAHGPMVIVTGPVNFHIYRDGWVSRDCRIMAGDKKNMAYHIEYPYNFLGSWNVNMRRGGPKGPTVFLITRSAIGGDFTIQDPANPVNTTKLSRSGGVIGKRKHTFKGFDGVQYAWKGSQLGGDLKLISYPTKTVVAFYHRARLTWSKEGRLEILPNGQHLLDLIVATGFAVEEWERQNR